MSFDFNTKPFEELGPVESATLVIEHLKENRFLLKDPLGRKILKECKEVIKNAEQTRNKKTT